MLPIESLKKDTKLFYIAMDGTLKTYWIVSVANHYCGVIPDKGGQLSCFPVDTIRHYYSLNEKDAWNFYKKQLDNQIDDLNSDIEDAILRRNEVVKERDRVMEIERNILWT